MNVEDLRRYLQAMGVDARILTFKGHTRTVEEAEKRLGVGRERVIKSLLFLDESGRPVIGIVTGDRKVDGRKLARACGARKVKIAPPNVVEEFTGYRVGAMPPIGHKTPIRVFIDPEVMRFDRVYGGGGAENALLEIRPEDIRRLTNAEVVEISK